MNRRVVVTGMGIVSPVGSGLDKFWNNLLAGHNAIDRVGLFDVSEYASQMDAEVRDFDPAGIIDAKELNRLDRFVQFALVAAHGAVTDAKLDVAAVDAERFGVIMGSGIGGIATFEAQHEVLRTKGPKRVSPFLVPMMIGNMASGNVSIHFGAKGINYVTTTACASANHAIGESMHAIRRGDADLILCGGAEAAITPLTYAGFTSMKAFSRRNDDPKTACRPFNGDRDGFVIGEGAAVLLIESEEHARARGARIYCELAGYGATADANHITAPAPEGEGAQRAIRMALKSAGLAPTDIDYVNAHGTSTPLNDKFEVQAIKGVFGKHAYDLKVSSTKSMHGHLLGAAAAVEAVATVKAIHEGRVPPTINQITPDPELDLNFVPEKAVEATVRAAISNSLGFGGHNAVVCFKKF